MSSDTRLVRSFLACFCLVLNLSQEMLPHRILMITLHTFQFFNTIKVFNGSFILLLFLIFIFSMIFISFFLRRILQVPIMLQLKESIFTLFYKKSLHKKLTSELKISGKRSIVKSYFVFFNYYSYFQFINNSINFVIKGY